MQPKQATFALRYGYSIQVLELFANYMSDDSRGMADSKHSRFDLFTMRIPFSTTSSILPAQKNLSYQKYSQK